MEYRNFKGWPSILAVAFVDSYYRFFDIDVGYPGRAGDNTVLKQNWLMREIGQDPDRWLGPGGVILGDSGASDGDQFFLNPYHSPEDPTRSARFKRLTLDVSNGQTGSPQDCQTVKRGDLRILKRQTGACA